MSAADMNERILSVTGRESFRVFRWQQEPSRDEHGRFASDAEPEPFQGADGGARGPEAEAEPPTMSDLIAGVLMQKQSEQGGWARLAQSVRQADAD